MQIFLVVAAGAGIAIVACEEADAYLSLGPGFCETGFYAGGDLLDAASLGACKQRCSAEPQCHFFSLKLQATCQRYGVAAGDCFSRSMGRENYISYRRLVDTTTTRFVAPKHVLITMEEFNRRMLNTYATPLHAFQAFGSNPVEQEAFVRGTANFKPPLTFDQARYAFHGLDANHDGQLKSFEFFEVLQGGLFYPTPGQLRVTRDTAAASSDGTAEGPWVSFFLPIALFLLGIAACAAGMALGSCINRRWVNPDPRETYVTMIPRAPMDGGSSESLDASLEAAPGDAVSLATGSGDASPVKMAL